MNTIIQCANQTCLLIGNNRLTMLYQNSNVVKFFGLLNKDPNHQLCYYDPGVGTWFRPGVVSPLFEWGAKILDLALAWYLDQHVMDGYRFLMQNYREGDKICLFGKWMSTSSRG
jgi:uncharacterized protein (DUF2235 family)